MSNIPSPAGRAGHTAGPWNFEADETSSGPMFAVYDEHGARLTDAYIGEREARLIAAAPGLVKALEPLAEIADGIASSVPDQFEILIKIDAAPVGRCTVGQLRHARAALSSAQGNSNNHNSGDEA